MENTNRTLKDTYAVIRVSKRRWAVGVIAYDAGVFPTRYISVIQNAGLFKSSGEANRYAEKRFRELYNTL